MRLAMGSSMSIYLTEYDLDEVIRHVDNRFNRSEVLNLYKRFRELDKGHKGYISSDELLNVPELSLNPLALRLAHLFENVNFLEFVKLLSHFSDRCPRKEKLRFIFQVHDVDGDNVISQHDLEHMTRTLCGSQLSEEELNRIVRRVLAEACPGDSGATQITFEDFHRLFESSEEEVKLQASISQWD